VKLQKHLNIVGKNRYFLKTGKTCEANQNRGKNNFCLLKGVDVKQKNMKKIACLFLAVTLIFSACSKGDDNEKINPDNLFAGTWVGKSGYVTVTISETTWAAQYESKVYNSGTYTYDDNSAVWTITNKGMSSANVGDTGSATISNGELTVANFNDQYMNGIYSKQ
jgi:hypothetical protein